MTSTSVSDQLVTAIETLDQINAHLRSIVADVESGSFPYLGSQLFIVITNLTGLHHTLETCVMETRPNHVLMLATPTLVSPSEGDTSTRCRVITRVVNLKKMQAAAKW